MHRQFRACNIILSSDRCICVMMLVMMMMMYPLSLSGRASTFHYLSARERWTGRESVLREVPEGLHPTTDSVEVIAPTPHPLHPPDPHCPLLPGHSPAPPPQRGTALCQAEVGPTFPTTPREVQAPAQALAPPAHTHPPLQEDQHRHQPPLPLLHPQPAPLPHTDTQSLIPTHSHTHCLKLAGLWMEVSVWTYVSKCLNRIIEWDFDGWDFFLCLPVSARTSPKAQRPPQSSRTVRAANSHAQSTGTFGQL